jgi:hypothetical protein
MSLRPWLGKTARHHLLSASCRSLIPSGQPPSNISSAGGMSSPYLRQCACASAFGLGFAAAVWQKGAAKFALRLNAAESLRKIINA